MPTISVVLNFLLGSISTIVIGIVTDLLTGAVSRGLRQLRGAWTHRRRIKVDVRHDGLFVVGEWSPNRILEEDRLVTTFITRANRPSQPWIDSQVLDQEVAACVDSGAVTYVSSFTLDHRESKETQRCHVTLAQADYREVRALEKLRLARPSVLSAADSALTSDASTYLRSAVPSSLAANVVIVSEGAMLCARRSAAVHNAVGLWTVGIFEAMKQSDPNTPGRREDFFELVKRGVAEELGLHDREFESNLFLTWFGIYRPILRGHLVAVAGTSLTQERVVERARRASSSYEHDALDWLALSPKTVRKFVRAQRVDRTGEAGEAIEVDGRPFLEQSRLAVMEAWRFRPLRRS